MITLRRFAILSISLLVLAGESAALPQNGGDSFTALTPTERLTQLLQPDVTFAACCKTCRKGKACGNSCISKNKTCRKGKGCACDG